MATILISIFIPCGANTEIIIPPGKKAIFPETLTLTPDSYQLKYNITGYIPVGITPETTYLPHTLIFPEIQDGQIIINLHNKTTTKVF